MLVEDPDFGGDPEYLMVETVTSIYESLDPESF